MADELNDVKRPLEEQKTIDRARLLMMEQLKLSEAEAYRKNARWITIFVSLKWRI
jgi:AmiR/NasT family two-component response regulator